MSLNQILLVAALVLFVVDAWKSKSLTAAGLACWVGSLLLRF